MGKRRDGREAAVQFLFNRDLNSDLGEDDFETFFGLRLAKKGVQEFAAKLVRGVIAHQHDIDERISARVDNFEFNRLSVVDRNVLRLAVYEMFHRDDVPPIVCINEAIEISKRFGTEDSGNFVNGVLDRLKSDLTRPLR
jgi:N utilization substance protein B